MKRSSLTIVVLGAAIIAFTALFFAAAQSGDTASVAAVHPSFAHTPSLLGTPPGGALPGRWWFNTILQARNDGALWQALALLAMAAVMFVLSPRELLRLRISAAALGAYALSLPLAGAVLASEDLAHYGRVRFVTVLLQEVSLVSLLGIAVLEIGSRLLKTGVFVIITDIVLVGAYAAVGLELLGRAGFNISGIIATSAVLTAVIGFSLQDSLGNVMSGVVLSLENVVKVGDWVKVGDVNGRVKEIRWRQTTIETRDWDIVVVPNSVLMKQQVVVLGRRDGAAVAHRQWIYFNVDLASPPGSVVRAVNGALLASPIENVAAEPEPHCIMMDFRDGVGVYAVRYWLSDIGPDDPTDACVRERIYFALQRAGLRIASPTRSIVVTEDTPERRDRLEEKAQNRREEALRRAEIFASLDESEVREVAEGLRHAPFAANEVITRQGDVSDSLYLIMAGTASVSVSSDSLEKSVAELHAGTVFGEMGLLTGEPRSATVRAATELDCWRLDRAAFEHVVRRRPEIASELSRVLAHRRIGLDAAREDLARDREARGRLTIAQDDMLARIRTYLGLHAGT